MAFSAHLHGRTASARCEAPSPPARRFVRNRVLGTEALYELLEDDGELVRAEVLQAPGLVPGTSLRLLARATRAMEQVDPAEPIVAARLAPSGPRAAV